MVLKILFIILLTFMLCGCDKIIVQWPNPFILSQFGRIEGKSQIGLYKNSNVVDEEDLPIAYGTIYLKDKNELKGKIWLKPIYSSNRSNVYRPEAQIISKPWSEISKNNLDSFWSKKDTGAIDSIKMSIPLPDGLGDTTVFINRATNEYFWRLLLHKNDVEIFDVISDKRKDYRSTTLIAITEKQSTVVFHVYGIKSIKKKLKSYILKKYGQHVSDSSTITNMLKFILNKETELTREPLLKPNNILYP